MRRGIYLTRAFEISAISVRNRQNEGACLAVLKAKGRDGPLVRLYYEHYLVGLLSGRIEANADFVSNLTLRSSRRALIFCMFTTIRSIFPALPLEKNSHP